MHYIKVLNKFKNSLSNNDKIRIFIDYLENSIINRAKPNADEKEFLNHVCQTIFTQKKYQTRLAKILSYVFQTCHHNNRESKYAYLIKCFIDNEVKIDFNHQFKDKSASVATAIFYIANQVFAKQKNKLLLFQDLFKLISQQKNIDTLYYYSLKERLPFLAYFFDVSISDYCEFICHIALNHKKYNFELKDSFFIKSIIGCASDEFEQYKIKILTQLPLHYITESKKDAYSDGPYGFTYNALDAIFCFCDEKTIQSLFELKPNLFNGQSVDPLIILENIKLSLNYKLKLLEKFNIKKISLNSIYLAPLNEEKKTQEKVEDFINHCVDNFEVYTEVSQFENLNHLLCYYRQDANPYVLRNIILRQQLPHVANKYGYYPIHLLASYSTCYFNPPKLDEIINILKELKKQNVNLNSTTKKGNNALHIALRLQKPPLFIKELLLSGVEVATPNQFGKTAYDYFLKYRYSDKEILKNLFQTYYEKQKFEKEIVNDNTIIEKKSKKI